MRSLGCLASRKTNKRQIMASLSICPPRIAAVTDAATKMATKKQVKSIRAWKVSCNIGCRRDMIQGSLDIARAISVQVMCSARFLENTVQGGGLDWILASSRQKFTIEQTLSPKPQRQNLQPSTSCKCESCGGNHTWVRAYKK